LDDIGACQPIVNGSLNPRRHRDGSNVTGFANQIDDGPVILATLEMINGQSKSRLPPERR
jgi:hypothetical protein